MKFKSTARLAFPLASAIAALLASPAVHAADGTWDTDAAGNWTDITNWVGNAAFASGADSTATLGDFITIDRPITLSSGITIGNITASDISNNYSISGAHILNLARTDATQPTITVSDAARTLTISSQVSGSGGLQKSGAGTLTLTKANTYTGGTVINGGTLNAALDANLGAAGAANGITLTGNANLGLGNNVTYARNLILNSSAIVNFTSGGNPIISGNVTGTGGIIMTNGFGTQINFTGTANTFEGAINIGSTGTTGQAYRMQFSSFADSATATGRILFSASTVTHADGSVFQYNGTTNLTLANRQIEIASTGSTPANGHQIRSSGVGTLTVGTDLIVTSTANAQTLNFTGVNTGANTFSGKIVDGTGSGIISLRKTAAGLWSVTNVLNSYTGGTTVSGGTLRFASGALGTTGAINASGGTLQWGPINNDDLSSRLATTAAGITTLDTNGNDVTFASTLGTANTGLLVKTGLGTLTLTLANNYTGTTTVNGGTLGLDYTTVDSKLADGAALILGGGTLDIKNGASSHTELVSASTLTNNTGSYVTQSSGSSVLQMNTITPGTGTVNFAAENIATTDNLNSATTGIIGAWATVGGDWAINSGATISTDPTVPGTGIADGFIRAYTGYTDVTRLGTPDVGIRIIADGSTTNVRLTEGSGDSGTVTLGAATTSINTLNQSISGGTSGATIDLPAQTLRTNAVLMGSTAGDLTIGAAGGTAALSGTLAPTATTGSIIVTNSSNPIAINSVIGSNSGGTTSLVKTGTGVLVLNGLSTYLGGTFLQDGTLRVGATVGSFNTNGILGGVFNTGITMANKATAVFDLDGKTAFIKDLMAGGSLGGNVTLGSGTLVITNPSNNTNRYNGNISGAGNLTVIGSSSWNTAGAHTYTGITTLTSALFITTILADGGVASGIGQSSSDASNLIINNGSLSYRGTAAASTNRQFTFQGNGGLAVDDAGAITWSYTGAMTYSGAGTKTLTFSRDGAGIGTLAASIGDNSGSAISLAKTGTSTWRLTNASSDFTGAITLNTTTTSAGTLAYSSAGGANAITFNQTTSTATLSYIGATDKTMSGPILANALSTGTITFDSSGTGAVNYSNAASLGVAGASGAKVLALSGTNTGINILAGGWNNNTLGGLATVSKTGLGRWTLAGTNGYTGTTTITQGTLRLGSATAVSSSSAVNFATNQNSTLEIGTDTAFVSANVPKISAGFTNSSTTNMVSDRATTGAGPLGAGITHALAALDLGNTQMNVMAGSNVTSGTAAISFTSVLLASATTAETTTLNPTSADLIVVGAVTGSASTGTHTLNLSGTSTGNSIGGAITNGSRTTQSLTKSGPSTWALSGESTYTGTTVVNAGTLLINNSTGSGTGTNTVSVTAGTLGGSGFITGAVTIGDNSGTADAILAPGNSIDSIDTGNLTFNSDGSYAVEVNGSLVTRDVTNVTGSVSLNAATTLTVNVTGTLSASQQYIIVSNDGADAVTGTFATLAQGAIVGNFGGTDLKISYIGGDGNDIVLYTDAPVSTPYQDWATLKGLTGLAGSPTDPAKAADPDGDGKNNLSEFAFDGNPLSGANEGRIIGKIAIVAGSQVMTLTLPVRGTATPTITPTFSADSNDQLSTLIDGIYYRIEGDVTLSTFADAISEVTGGDAATIQSTMPPLSGAGWTYRTFRAPGTVPTVPKAFLRAKVSETP